jgi:glycosyltransferase involved in cell wall biosynthesis
MSAQPPDHLRILHIIPYYSPAWSYGGPVRAIYELTHRLVQRGHEVTVYTTDALDASHRADAGVHELEGVIVHRFPNWSNTLAWNRLFFPRGFRRSVKQTVSQFNIAHLNEFRTVQNAEVLPLLRRHRLPYVIMPQGSLPAELGRTAFKRVYDSLVGASLLKQAARLHALNEMERDQYVALGLAPNRIWVSPNGIDVSAFDLEDVDVPAFKRQHNIPEGRPVVGFLARLNHIKAPEFLVDAFADVLQALPDAILMLVGPDDGVKSEIQEQIRRLGIGDMVRFVGYIGDQRAKAAAYRASDVYVLPSRYEIQGITLLEALLNRVPTITTDRCGLSSGLAAAGAAHVVPFGDVPALAEQILWVLNNSAEARREAEQGRSFVVKHFDWEVLTDEWCDVYRSCIEESKVKRTDNE